MLSPDEMSQYSVFDQSIEDSIKRTLQDGWGREQEAFEMMVPVLAHHLCESLVLCYTQREAVDFIIGQILDAYERKKWGGLMEENFQLWLKICKKEGSISEEDALLVKQGDRDRAERIFLDFCSFYRSAITDFVQDCFIQEFTRL